MIIYRCGADRSCSRDKKGNVQAVEFIDELKEEFWWLSEKIFEN
jgi:hypothetical protein